MDNPSRDSQQSGEKKPLLGGSQVLLYMLLIATAAGFFASFLIGRMQSFLITRNLRSW
jgi:hypothetical protein